MKKKTKDFSIGAVFKLKLMNPNWNGNLRNQEK